MGKVIKKITSFLLTIVVLILIWIFVVSAIKVENDEMSPTLKSGDIMIVNKIIYKLSDVRRFDTVIYKHDNINYVRRVLGIPGDTLKYIDNKLIIDGKQYVSEATLDLDNFSIEDFGYDKVPEDFYLVVSDNKNNTNVSVGLIPKEEVYGRLTMRLWPFDTFGFIK